MAARRATHAAPTYVAFRAQLPASMGLLNHRTPAVLDPIWFEIWPYADRLLPVPADSAEGLLLEALAWGEIHRRVVLRAGKWQARIVLVSPP